MTLTAVDLCCGAGGWAVAARGLPIRFVAVADIDPLVLQTWVYNHAVDHPQCKVVRCDLSKPVDDLSSISVGNSIRARPTPACRSHDGKERGTLPAARSVRNGNSSRVGNDSMRVLDSEKASPTVLSALNRGSRQRRAWMVELPDGRYRRLTWQEAARLQGFPDDYVFCGAMGAIERQIGRAIPIHVGRAILKAIVQESELHGSTT